MNDLIQIRGQLRVCQIPGACLQDPRCGIDPREVDDLARRGHAQIKTVRDNLIVDGGLGAVSRLLGFGQGFNQVGGIGFASVSDLQVTEMRLVSNPAASAPLATDTDVSLNPPTYAATPVTVFYPSDTSVTLVAVIPQAQSSLDGIGFNEEGLFLANGALIARVLFPAEVKLPTNAIQFEHTITVQRV